MKRKRKGSEKRVKIQINISQLEKRNYKITEWSEKMIILSKCIKNNKPKKSKGFIN